MLCVTKFFSFSSFRLHELDQLSFPSRSWQLERRRKGQQSSCLVTRVRVFGLHGFRCHDVIVCVIHKLMSQSYASTTVSHCVYDDQTRNEFKFDLMSRIISIDKASSHK